jgi:hypothetical protein
MAIIGSARAGAGEAIHDTAGQEGYKAAENFLVCPPLAHSDSGDLFS